jgi:hypothetical protein
MDNKDVIIYSQVFLASRFAWMYNELDKSVKVPYLEALSQGCRWSLKWPWRANRETGQWGRNNLIWIFLDKAWLDETL